MPKYGSIVYEFEDGDKIVFEYQGEVIKLPIQLGESARSIMHSYISKLHRGTAQTPKAKKIKNLTDDRVLRKLAILAFEIGREYRIQDSYLRSLRLELSRKDLSPDLEADLRELISTIKPQKLSIPQTQVDFVVAGVNTISDAKLQKMYAIVEPDIREKKELREKLILDISELYENHKSKIIDGEPRSITKAAAPLKEWFL